MPRYRDLIDESKQPEGCFWRLLLPLFLSSILCFLVAAASLRPDPWSILREPEAWPAAILGMSLCVAAGLLLIVLPVALRLARAGVRFKYALPSLLFAGILGGPAILGLMFLPAGASLTALLRGFGLLAALCGFMSTAVWLSLNRDLFSPADSPDGDVVTRNSRFQPHDERG